MDCGGPAQEVSEGSNISNWSRDHSFDILTKTVPVFCLYLNNLPEARLKGFVQISLVDFKAD